jgi:amino acid transporter
MGTGFFASTAGLLVAVLIALFTPHHTFIHDFNITTRGFTGVRDTYHAILAAATKAGVNVSPKFSWGATIAVAGVFAGSLVYTYFASFAGGELRQAASRRTSRRMAIGGTLSLTIDIVCIFVLTHTWGRNFLTAWFFGGFHAQLGSVPAYFTLVSFQVGNTIFAVLMCLSFLVVFPMFAGGAFIAFTRSLFAYAFDGLLPERITTVSKRTNAPTAAIGASLVVFVLALVYAIFIATDLLQIIAYVTVIQNIPMMLVGLAAVLLPYRRPELYRASGLARTIAGVPVVVIAGAAAILAGAFMDWIYFHYSVFGLTDAGKFLAWCGGVAGAGVVYYIVMRVIRRRQGVDLALVYAEIPPE